MKKSLLFISLVVIVVLLMSMVAYGLPKLTIKISNTYKWKGDSVEMVNTSAFKKTPPFRIGFSNASTSNSFGVTYFDEVKWEAAKWSNYASFFYTDAQDSSAKQISDCEDLLAKNIDLLVIRPCTANSLLPVLDKAKKLGIPVVLSNRSVSNSTDFVTLVGTRMVDMGANMAKYMAEQLKGKGNIVSIEGTPGSGPQIERWQGSESVLKNYPDIKVLVRGTTSFSTSEAKTLMENYLQAYPKIDGVLSQAGMMSVGIAEAIQEAGKDPKKYIITGDDYNGWMKWMYKNKAGMGTTNPSWCGAASVVTALMVLNGEPVPKFWDMGTDVFTNQNGLLKKLVLLDKPDTEYPSIIPKK